ncbi:caspase-3-like [Prorops nasuta]|uniref:caspase-3-like n=1 Tax=Prorops nasuta TaxID=863751 RepID=UPI0034CF5BFF
MKNVKNMNSEDRNKIDCHCDEIVALINMRILWPKLLENEIYYRDDVNIFTWSKNLSSKNTIKDIILTIKTRGPNAFKNFLLSLRQTNHQVVADILEGTLTNNDRAVLHELSNNDMNMQKKPELPINEKQESKNDAAPGMEENAFSDTYEHDNYHAVIQHTEEVLKINVKKSTQFLDGPDYINILRYPMRSNPRGLVLIISNIHYVDQEPRMSAVFDEHNLRLLFEQMGFKVITYRDLKANEIREALYQFSRLKELHRVDSCFVIITSHGKEGDEKVWDTEIQAVDCHKSGERDYKKIYCSDVYNYFTAEACPNLAGKPKAFFFQICRGKAKQKTIQKNRSSTDTIEYSTKNLYPNVPSTRNYTDMIVAHSTLPGHVSFRDTEVGSWFIQILCEVLMNHAHKEHLQDLLNMVDQRLEKMSTIDEECQTLVVTSYGFSKHCYLNPGLFEE